MRFHKLEESLLKEGDVGSAAVLRDAEKFYIGDVGVFPNKSIDFGDFPRLPYSVTAIEMEVAQAFTIDRENSVPMRVIAVGKEIKGCTQFILFYESFDGAWELFGDFAVVPSSSVGNRVVFGGLRAHAGGAKFDWQMADLTKVSPVLADTDEQRDRMCAFFVASFLRVLNCVNVKTEEVPAPVKLNKKRNKNRKLPIYSYKTLVLTSRSERLIRGVGSHESPRIHLRRGHIKHRKTGDFWWQPHVVGDRTRGVVMKDYRADKLVEASR